MTDKLKLGLLGLLVILTAYNTYKLSNIDNQTNYEIEKTTLDNSINNVNNKTYVEPAPLKNKKENQFPDQIKNNPLSPQINNSNSGPTTNIKFKDDIKDFGNVDVDSENKFSFEFLNSGDEPLIISNAKGSCGCTVPDWPKEPIMPGKKGVIDVIYKPNKSQAGSPQQKTVTVTANTNPANTILNIKAVVNPEK